MSRVLFVDMDETLLHSSPYPARGAYEIETGMDRLWTLVRPDAFSAMEEAHRLFDHVYLMTAADAPYARAALKATGLRPLFERVFTADTDPRILPDVSKDAWVLLDDNVDIAYGKVRMLGGDRATFRKHWEPVRAFRPSSARDAARGGRWDDLALTEGVYLAFQKAEAQEER